jgi:phage baseplate assembly protein W
MPEAGKNLDPRAYLGTGIAFPLRMSVQGSFQLSSAERNIEEAIAIILRTRLGERVRRPNFGSRLFELAFSPMNTRTLLLIRLYVQEALQRCEPRIVVDAVYAEPDPMLGKVNVTIEYHPKETHDTLSIVYPFYLLPQS